MRLSLRMLLDYLDDRLAPEIAREIGDHVQEHDKLRQLTDRIKRVVRRRRLATPDIAERDELPVHHEDDPNQVAAYLDGQLNEELEADFEEICIDTDVYLAEVAACHQILSLGEQDVLVPPFARQRMYGLVEGPEAQPLRVVPREQRPSKAPLWEVDERPGHDDETQGPLEPLYHDLSGRWRQFMPVATILLLALLVVLVVWNLPRNLEGLSTEVAVDTAVAKEPVALKGQAVLGWPAPVLHVEGQPEGQQAAQAVGEVAGLLAARPLLPPNLLLGLGSEVTPVVAVNPPPRRVENEPVVPLPPIEKAKPHMPPPQLDARMVLGVNAAEGPGMFMHGPLALAQFVRPQQELLSNDLLIALPGYTGTINLQSQLKLTLVGQFTPTLAASPVAESVAELHPALDADLDVTLHRGRLVIVGRAAAPPAKVRLRYRGEGWELTLHPSTEIGVEATARVLPGEAEWQLRYQLDLIISQGRADVSRNGQTITLGPKGQLSWNSQLEPTKPGVFAELVEVPAWLTKRQTTAKEHIDSLVAFRTRTNDKLRDNPGKDLTWFRLACEESLDERRLAERQAALLGLAAVDHLGPVVREMNDPAGNGRRKYAHDVVHQWLNQSESRAEVLLKLLADTGYPPADAKLLLALFRSVPKSSPPIVQALLANMNHPFLAIREQAYRDLSILEPDRPGVYDPITPEEQRLKAIEVIRNRLAVSKKPGVVPPPP